MCAKELGSASQQAKSNPATGISNANPGRNELTELPCCNHVPTTSLTWGKTIQR
jgi:hypothetical protein